MGYSGLRFLEPNTVRAFRSEMGSLSVEIENVGTYQDVKVFRSFPLSDPSKYISLRVGKTKSEETEIGVIRDLAEVRPESREILWYELTRRYLIHTITKVNAITEEFAFLHWDVNTDKGPRTFYTPMWVGTHVVECGKDGRAITDIYRNRYVIPDLKQLDPDSQRVFRRFIFW